MRDPRKDGFIIAAAIWVGAIAGGLVPPGVDALNFYGHLDTPYRTVDYASGQGFYYAPPVALALRLLLPFGPAVFGAVMTAIGLAALYWIGGRWAWALLFFPPVWWDVTAGNVNTLIGAASVAFLARPAWIAIPIFTKVTPGIIGLWWLVRGEWRPAARAAVVVGAIAGASILVVPDWWTAWIAGLISNGTGYVPIIFAVPVPLLPRLLVAAVLVAVAGRTNRGWLLPVAACLALPVLWWSGFAILVALTRRPSAEPPRQA
jgi:hypothetical protein